MVQQRRSFAPQPLGAVLGQSRALTRQTANIGLEDWRRAVGSRLAERATPESLSGVELTVRVPSSTWAQEIQLLSPLLLERLREAGYSVQRLRFRVSATTALRGGARSVSCVRRSELPEALLRKIESVRDEALREVLLEAASLSLGRQQR